jgi:hypothetical protein
MGNLRQVLLVGFFRQYSWLLALLAAAPASQNSPATQPAVGQWGVFEASLPGPIAGNPFVDVDLSAEFTCAHTTITVHGFYDGDGVYRIRFMPPSQGVWTYTTQSNAEQLSNKTGSFSCGPASPGNHGPVRVANTYHFAYAGGTPYICIGTTCYAWALQPDAIVAQTLASLQSSPFNKVRMCILPGKADLPSYPYARDAAGNFDHARFDPKFFRRLEKCVAQLGNAGIEADLILFHPYHKGKLQWFDEMNVGFDERYLHYVVARFAAYHNVWWSLANEYGQIKSRTDGDWDHFFQIVAADDPYNHLRSIHNAQVFYDSNKPWVTHASVQSPSALADFGRAVFYRDICRKPIVYDEVRYEGHLDRRWGNLSAQEMVQRFWLGTIAGTYVGHGETLSGPLGVAWTSDGGNLMGQSPPRIAFLRKILEAGPPEGIEPIDEFYQPRFGGHAGDYYLVYFGSDKPTSWNFYLPRDPPNKTALSAGMKFHLDVLDTWNMTSTPLPQTFILGELKDNAYPADGDAKVPLCGSPWIALRIRRD